MVVKNDPIDMVFDVLKIAIIAIIVFIITTAAINSSLLQILKVIVFLLGVSVYILFAIWFLTRSRFRLSGYKELKEKED